MRISSSSGVAAALMAAVLVAGCSSAGGGPSEPASATPGPTPTATVATTVEPGPSATPAPPPCPQANRIADTYEIGSNDTQTIAVTITLNEGWDGCGLWFKELGEPGGVMMIGFWDAVDVYANPCRWRDSLIQPSVGPSVDDLAEAMVAQDLTEADPPTDVTLDGYAGRYVRLAVPVDLDTGGCDRVQIPEFRFLNGPGDSVWWLGAADAPGLIGELWIIDVDGRRVVVQAASFVDAGEARRDEIHGIVETIDFLP